ncbi:MAG: hypothetical protein JNL79_26210 [Myxococcales bacterium]|nr:hypothetical protein [Myxococcales bacterium]
MRRRPLLVSALFGAGLLVSACGRSGFPDDELAPTVDSATDTTLETTTDGGDTGSLETDIPPFDEGVDTDFDTGVLFDTDLPPDSIVVLDSIVGEDTAAFDTAGFDTAVLDTAVVDTGAFDTAVIDTGDLDTGLLDTGLLDTGVTDSTVFDTGFDTGFDAPPDTPTDTPIEGGITCGATTCDGLTQDCCASFTGLSCVPKGKCTGGGTLSCSDSTSCPTGQVCCFGGLGGGGGPSAKCAPVCAGIQLCKTSAECKAPNTCQPVFGGFRVCR